MDATMSIMKLWKKVNNMAQVDTARMKEFIDMGYDKEEAYEIVKKEAEEVEASKNQEESKVEKLEAELEALKKKEEEPKKEESKKEEPVLNPESIKKNEESYIDVLKKFC